MVCLCGVWGQEDGGAFDEEERPTLIRDERKSLVKKAKRRKLVKEAGSKDEEEEDDQWETLLGFLAKEWRSLKNASLVALFSAAISDLKNFRLLDLEELNESLGAGSWDSNCEEAEKWVLYETLCVMRIMEFCLWDPFRLNCMLHNCGIALCALCQSAAASREVWLVLCPLHFSGPLLFGYKSSLWSFEAIITHAPHICNVQRLLFFQKFPWPCYLSFSLSSMLFTMLLLVFFISTRFFFEFSWINFFSTISRARTWVTRSQTYEAFNHPCMLMTFK